MKKQRPTRHKLYALFAQSRCGNIYGYVENSFNMSFRKECVRVWDLQSAVFYLNEFNKKKGLRVYKYVENGNEYGIGVPSNDNSEENAHDIVKFFLVRVNSANSPIQIDMSNRRNTSKFNMRNRPFSSK